MCCDLYPFVNLVWQWRWVPSSERLLCFCCCRHKCQAAALYLLLSKAVLTASLHGLLEAHYFVSYQPLTPVQREGDPTISLWITCPLCVTRGQPALLSKTHTFLHWQVLFLRGTSGSVPLFLSTHKTAVKKLISQLWDLSWSSVAKKKWEKRKAERLQGEVGLVKTALHTSPPSPIYLQIIFPRLSLLQGPRKADHVLHKF